MFRLPFLVSFGLWQAQRMADLLAEHPDYYGDE